MLKVRNLGSRIFLPSGKWFGKNAVEDLTSSEVSLLKSIGHSISVETETKKKKK